MLFPKGDCHLGSLLYIQALGQQVGNVDEAHQVVHIALYAASHSWVLDLHGKAAPIMQIASMHLRCHGSQWLLSTKARLSVQMICVRLCVKVGGLSLGHKCSTEAAFRHLQQYGE